MIDFAEIDPDSTLFSTFNSNAQKVVRIPGKGIAVSRITQRNAAYTAQRQKIDLYDEDLCHIASLYDGVAASQAPVVQASARGELFAVWNDWAANTISVLKWPDVCMATTPAVVPPIPCGSAGGKFSAIWDDGRRALFFANNANGLFRFNPDGSFKSGAFIFTPAQAVPLEYPYLLPVHEDGALEIAWTNRDVPLPLNYYSAHYARTPDSGASWAPSSASYAYPIPISTLGGLRIDQPEETSGYKWLMAAHSDGGSVHFMYVYNANRGEQIFTNPQNSVLEYVRIDRAMGSVQKRLRPFRTESVPVGSLGGMFARRAGRLYFVTTTYDGPAVVAYVSEDNGDTWREHSREGVPHSAPITLYSLGGDPGKPWHPDIVGPFTVAHGTGADVMANVNIPTSTYLFRVCL